jgi:MFS family permease
MQGVFMSVFAIAAIGGPIIGGILTDQLGWRWVFYVNIPIGIVASTIVALTMPRIRTEATLRNIDVRGALLLAAGVVPLLSALSSLGEAGWTSPTVVGLLLVSAVMLGAFVLGEVHVPHPVMPLNLFRTPTFTVSIIVSFLAAFGMFGSNIYVPLLYQGLLGVSATQSGVLLTPRMLAMVVASFASGQIITRVKQYRFVGAAGLASLATGLFLLSRVTASSNELEVIRGLVLIGIGFGSTQPIYQNAVMSAVPHAYVGVASSQVQFWRSLGQTIGVAVLGAVLATQIGQVATNGHAVIAPTGTAGLDTLATGLREVFVVAALAVAIAVVITLFLEEVPLRGAASSVESTATIVAPEAASIGE